MQKELNIFPEKIIMGEDINVPKYTKKKYFKLIVSENDWYGIEAVGLKFNMIYKIYQEEDIMNNGGVISDKINPIKCDVEKYDKYHKFNLDKGSYILYIVSSEHSMFYFI